jgi:hypothetical protein
VLPLNPGAGEFSGEQAHLKGQQDALFPGHRTMNRILDGLRRKTGIADGHGTILVVSDNSSQYRFTLSIHNIEEVRTHNGFSHRHSGQAP